MREVLLLSHELRTPLAVIAGYLEILEQHDLQPEAARRVHDAMRDAVAELNRTIEVLIDRERRVAIAYGLGIPELIEPALLRNRTEIVPPTSARIEPAGEGP